MKEKFMTRPNHPTAPQKSNGRALTFYLCAMLHSIVRLTSVYFVVVRRSEAKSVSALFSRVTKFSKKTS